MFAQFDLNFLIPRIIGRQVNLHPMVVIIGIIVGASVGGVLGVALAAPVIASIRVLGRYVYCRLFGLDPFADSITAQGGDDDAPAEDAPAQVADDEAMGGVHEEVA